MCASDCILIRKMRLINAITLELKEFFDSNIPKYAILSHTWDSDELSYQEMIAPNGDTYQKHGYVKIKQTCEQALLDGHHWVWVDTVTIDKTSSAELSENINSMFRCVYPLLMKDCIVLTS